MAKILGVTKLKAVEDDKLNIVNPFPNNFSKLKELADDKFEIEENSGRFFEIVENTVGNRPISSFPTMFSKDLHCRHLKTRACLGKGLKWRFDQVENTAG